MMTFSSHLINAYKEGGIGESILKQDYEFNKNLFAFNYPNQDFNQYNADKLFNYINEIKVLAIDGEASVQYSDIYATKQDKADLHARFTLIGHSNGGLVSRYYIENLGGHINVDKLITINTPHFGSGLAYVSNVGLTFSAFNPLTALYYPLDVELRPDSSLFGGTNKLFMSNFFGKKTDYINWNQSPALEENTFVDTEYYAIGGYDVGEEQTFNPNSLELTRYGEIEQIPDELKDSVFSFEFDRDTLNKDSFNESILEGVKSVNAEVTLNLGNSDDDNVVETMSQFGVKFSLGGKLEDYVVFKRTALVVDTNYGHDLVNHFHGKTLWEEETQKWLIEFIND